jgi:RHH-type proline utilization regulon transcriptional repressor/proline dehydrogenase/delta 1-pyrroline-5-carboxylate dehydrogenase
MALNAALATGGGPIVSVTTGRDGVYRLDNLVQECVVSTNTAAAGGNASLMAIG